VCGPASSAAVVASPATIVFLMPASLRGDF
jgi:hypothetical protein